MFKNKAQSLSEYSICLSVVLIVFTAINIYVKRGLQGRYKDVVGYTAKQANSLRQYEPYYVRDENKVNQDKSANEKFQDGGSIMRNFIKDKTVVTGTNIRNVE